MDRCDASFLKELRAKLGITDSKRKLLLLGALGLGEVGGEELLESGGNLGLSNRLDVLKSLLSGLERV